MSVLCSTCDKFRSQQRLAALGQEESRSVRHLCPGLILLDRTAWELLVRQKERVLVIYTSTRFLIVYSLICVDQQGGVKSLKRVNVGPVTSTIKLADEHPRHHSPHNFVETERTKAVAALGLQRPPQDFLTRVAQMLVFEAVGQNFLWEARLVAFQGRWWRRLLCSHYFL